jgi:hypothetical protein
MMVECNWTSNVEFKLWLSWGSPSSDGRMQLNLQHVECKL